MHIVRAMLVAFALVCCRLPSRGTEWMLTYSEGCCLMCAEGASAVMSVTQAGKAKVIWLRVRPIRIRLTSEETPDCWGIARSVLRVREGVAIMMAHGWASIRTIRPRAHHLELARDASQMHGACLV